MEALSQDFGETSLHDASVPPDQLLFEPSEGSKAEIGLRHIPHYLFRVVSPNSDGKTSEKWIRSKAVVKNSKSSTQDVFSYHDPKSRRMKAHDLLVHLQWWTPFRGEVVEDNFVSWTSSLLFAIQYIYYRHMSTRDRSRLEDIDLYIIDTTRFPRGTFMCDLDLITSFRPFEKPRPNKDLKSLHNLRTTKGYYFGEYLSQGSLRIENKCYKISANVLFDDDRLYRLQPSFAEEHINGIEETPRWAKSVVQLRETIWPGNDLQELSPVETQDRLKALNEIMDNISLDWKFPLAIYFQALVGAKIKADELGAEYSHPQTLDSKCIPRLESRFSR